MTDLNFTAEKYDLSEQLGVEFKWATRKSKKIWNVVYKVRLNDSCGCEALCINDRRFLCEEKRTISSKTALFGCLAMAVCLAFAISLILLCRRQRARRGSLLPASLSSQQTQVNNDNSVSDKTCPQKSRPTTRPSRARLDFQANKYALVTSFSIEQDDWLYFCEIPYLFCNC